MYETAQRPIVGLSSLTEDFGACSFPSNPISYFYSACTLVAVDRRSQEVSEEQRSVEVGQQFYTEKYNRCRFDVLALWRFGVWASWHEIRPDV